MVYFNKVNDGGKVKHLVLFASLEKPASPRVVRLLKAVKDGEKAFGGVHYVVINGKKYQQTQHCQTRSTYIQCMKSHV